MAAGHSPHEDDGFDGFWNPINECDDISQVLNHVALNQNANCFAVGRDKGFRVYQISPSFQGRISPCHLLSHGRIVLVGLEDSGQIFGLVGDGSAFSTNRVMIWDCRDKDQARAEFVELPSPVNNVIFGPNKLIVVLDLEIYLYDLQDLRSPVDGVVTYLNRSGLCSISYASSGMVLACPNTEEGWVTLHTESSSTRRFRCHSSRVASMAFTPDGRFLATASEGCALITIYHMASGSVLQGVLRGYETTELHNISFCNLHWLVGVSDRGTAIAFDVRVPPVLLSRYGVSTLPARKYKLPMGDFISSELQLPAGVKHFVAIGRLEITVMIIGLDGSYRLCMYESGVIGGEMTVLESHSF